MIRNQKKGEDIVFIIGSPRSGTTWVQKILASNENIVTAQESEIFTTFIGPIIMNYYRQLNNPSGRGGTGLPCYWTIDELHELLRQVFYGMLGQTGQYDGSKLFIEKTPSHALVVDKIALVLPRARFIHIVRDPRDVVSSLIAASKDWGKNWAPSNVLKAAIVWKRHVNSADQFLTQVPQRQKLLIRYENLKTDTLKHIIKMFSFCGIEMTDVEAQRIEEKSRLFTLRKYGEFGKRTGHEVRDPDHFIRKSKKKGWRDDIGVVRGLLVFLLLKNEIKKYGYHW